jgi:hypothetical protein
MFPEVTGKSLSELKVSIETAGLIQPGVLLEDGTMLDGRGRLRVCNTVGVPMRWTICIDTSPTGAVLRLNLQHRVLTNGQRDMLGYDLLPMLEKEAKERQGTRTDLGPTSEPNGAHVGVSQPNRAAAQAARLVGATTRGVQRAKRIASDKQFGSALADLVREGEIPSTYRAEQMLIARSAPRRIASPVERRVVRADARILGRAMRRLTDDIRNALLDDWGGLEVGQRNGLAQDISALRARLDLLQLRLMNAREEAA